MTQHPIQPIVMNERGLPCFKPNKIVEFLLDHCSKRGVDLNTLAIMPFSQEDREQFAQLIGYTLNGFAELSYVRDETYATAQEMMKGKDERDARIEVLEQMLAEVRDGLRKVVPVVFSIHPDDLTS